MTRFPQPRIFAILVFSIIISTTLESCCPGNCITRTPDLASFSKVTHSPAMRDSLMHNTLILGMPYSAVEMVFGGCTNDVGIPVASSGSRQKLDETEGLYSHYQDPDIQIYLCKFQTDKGVLNIWYGKLDFYRAKVAQDDSLFLFSGDKPELAIVTSLLDVNKLQIHRSVKNIPTTASAEIHSRNIGVKNSYYDRVSVTGKIVSLESADKSDYPILHMEIGSSPIQSFHWK